MEEEKERLLESSGISTKFTERTAKRNQRYSHLFLAISVSLNFFFLFFGFVAINFKQQLVAWESYERGFASDLDAVKSEIGLVTKKFSGGIDLDSHSNFVADKGGQEYVGIPEPAIDKAWQNLLRGLNLDFEQDETDLAGTFQWPDTGLYFSGLDVYHSLHCLNRIRQAIYPDYYTHIFDRPDDPARNDHINHCINHIRQSLQCSADLTPMKWRLEGSEIILKTDTPHTCRNWDKIQEWSESKVTRFDTMESWLNGSIRIVD